MLEESKYTNIALYETVPSPVDVFLQFSNSFEKITFYIEICTQSLIVDFFFTQEKIPQHNFSLQVKKIIFLSSFSHF